MSKKKENEEKDKEPSPSAEQASESEQSQDSRPFLEEASGLSTSRVGRFLKTGWAARHAVPVAFKRAVELMTVEKEDRGKVAEKLLQEQEAVAEELFRTLGNLKGVVQKFGQLASYLEDVFLDFEPEPFAAASVGQVHRARLHDGTKVAVKVQYPDIDRAFVSDIKNMKMLEMLFAPVIHYYRGRDILNTMRQQLLDELDYKREATMQETFRKYFADDPSILIPKVFSEFSTEKILVTEFMDGISFRQLQEADEEVRRRAGETISRYYLDSIFVHHLVNIDPHPGNYVFHDDGRVSFLDFGAAVTIDPRRADHLGEHIHAYITKDDETFRKGLNQLYGFPMDDPVMVEAYETMLRHFLQPLSSEGQPFRFSTGWMEGCVEEGMVRSKDILLRGGRIPKLPPPPTHVNPDLPVIYRIALGLGSLLARLEVAVHWPNLFLKSYEKRS